jgi:hypothetical protein
MFRRLFNNIDSVRISASQSILPVVNLKLIREELAASWAFEPFRSLL